MADAPAALERHPTLYFPDGDIALSAVTKAGIAQVFRVDRIFLSRHSEVFRDMFAVSSDTTSASESYDDVPLVTLPADDIAEDVQSLLEVMYNIAALHQKLSTRRRADTPLETTGLLRIAKKFLVKDVEDAVVQHVVMEWPKTLQEWDRRAAELKDIRRTSAYSHPEPVSAIKFASSYGVLSQIRQAAFYQLSITPTYNEWHETLQVQIPHKALDNICARWSLLDATELLAFVQGRDALEQFVLEQVKTILIPTTITRNTGFGGAKISPVKCDCKPGTFALVHQAHFGTGPSIDFLDELRLLEEKCANEQLGVCNKCKDRIAVAIPELRVKIWRKLPEFFSTPSTADS